MTCPTPDALLRFADGLSASGEAARIGAHLTACSSCRAMLAGWSEAEAALRCSAEDVPEGYFETLAGRIESRLEAPASAPLLAFRARRTVALRWALAAAATLFVAVVSPWLLRESQTPRLAKVPAEAAAVQAPPLQAPGVAGPVQSTGSAAEVFDPQTPQPARPKGDAASARPSGGLVDESTSGGNEVLTRRSRFQSDVGQERPSATATDRLSVAEAGAQGPSAGVGKDRLRPEKPLPAGSGASAAAELSAAPAAPSMHSPTPTPSALVPREVVRAEKAPPSPPSAQLSVPPATTPPPAAAGRRLAPSDAAKEKKTSCAAGQARPEAVRLARERAHRLEVEVRSGLEPAEADEAWASSVEAWFEAWQLGCAASDREAALASARSYLGAKGSRQRPRVRRVLEALGEME